MKCVSINENLNVKIAESFKEKFFGLMGKKNFRYGLLLENTNGIHTFFMRQKIYVVLLDKDYNILFRDYVKPWRVLFPKKGVFYTLELPYYVKIDFLKKIISKIKE